MSPLVLALDTTREFGSIALVTGNETLDEVLLHAPDGFGHILFENIARLLKRNKIALEDITLFAAASGPGSFTGVRIGLACIKGLAEATGKPAAGVSNLEALAEFSGAPSRAVVIDARRGEVYAALFGDATIPESVLPFQDFLDLLPPGPVEFISTDFAQFLPALNGTRFADSRAITAPRAVAAAVGKIAARRAPTDVAVLDANYVRRSDAELLFKG